MSSSSPSSAPWEPPLPEELQAMLPQYEILGILGRGGMGAVYKAKHALAICAHVLDALEYAHSHGIVHRDIKPANILLNREGRVKIADFGLAKKFGDHADADAPALTMSNAAVGTPDFVAPEALDSDQVPDHRADLYAVGVMLYQMLTGKLPRGNAPTRYKCRSPL